MKRTSTSAFSKLSTRAISSNLQSNYPVLPQGTYGVKYLDASSGAYNGTYVEIPNLSGQSTYTYYLAALNFTFINDTWFDVVVVPWVFQDDQHYGLLPAINMTGRYVMGGIGTQPTTILTAFPSPDSCAEGAVSGWPISGYWCCKHTSCPAELDYCQDQWQLAVAYKTDNTTDFIAIGNVGSTFASTPYDLPLECLTPPCSRLTLTASIASPVNNMTGAVRALWRSFLEVLNKLSRLLYRGIRAFRSPPILPRAPSPSTRAAA